MTHATHRHADGGFYKFLREVDGKGDELGADWVPGVLYEGLDGRPAWTTKKRWEDRFEELPPSRFEETIDHELHDDGGVIAHFRFHLEEAGDVRFMMIQAANRAARDFSVVVNMLKAIAEQVTKGLHVRDIDFPDLMGDVNAFHVKFDHAQENYGIPKILPPDLNDFRVKFHNEETTEYADEHPKLLDAQARGDHREIVNGLELQLDALADAVWVLLGTADIQFGRSIFYAAWSRVVKANMAKVRADRADSNASETGRDKKFDIVKPAGWTPPDHRDLVQDYLRIPSSEPTVQLADNSGRTIDTGYVGDGLSA